MIHATLCERRERRRPRAAPVVSLAPLAMMSLSSGCADTRPECPDVSSSSNAGEERVCHREKTTASQRSSRVCRTRAQLKAAQQIADPLLNRYGDAARAEDG